MGLEERMRVALRAAMLAGDPVATAALRSALAAVGNATAVPAEHVPASAGNEHVAGSIVGLGAAEVPRRELADADVVAAVRLEIAERHAAAAGYPPEAADRLRAEADVLAALLD